MLDYYINEQSVVYKILTNAIKNKKQSHAYLFETKGYSKALDVALAFSKALLCPLNKFNNLGCKDCSICKTIDDNNSINIKVINPIDNKIKKEQIEEMKLIFSKKTFNNTIKICIINEAEKMNDKTQNSLLKFIEEPEENILVILITENKYQLYETIISRCQVVTFNANVEVKGNKVEKIANYLNNDVEGTNKYIETENGKIDNILHFVDFFEENGHINTHLNINGLLFNYGYDINEIFQIMLLYYKDVLNYMNNRKIEIFEEDVKKIKKIAENNTISSIIAKMNVILDLNKYLKFNVNDRMIIDKLIISLGGVK